MIVLITMQERNPKTGKVETIVSHGIDEDSGSNVILPCETIEYFIAEAGARLDENMREYVIPNFKSKKEVTGLFNSCKSIKDLQALWVCLPNNIRHEYKALKDEMKARFG
jgi:hypothetical protein